MRKLYYLILLIISCNSFSQEMIQGKLLLEDYSTVKLFVLNKNSKETIETDSRGIFKMKMSEHDTLVFFQGNLIFDQYIVPDVVIASKSLRYILTKEGTQLDELIIDRGPNLNFGGTPKNREEKLEHQNSIKGIANNSMGITLDGVFNRISGRSKDIKRIVSLEKAERNFNNFKTVYSEELLTNQFNIPKDYVNPFIYFLVDEEDYNKDLVSLSEEYKLYLVSKVLKFKKEYEL